MKKSYILCLTLSLCLAFAATVQAKSTKFTLSSPQITAKTPMNVQQVYNGFGCTGANVSPELNWKNAPQGTKSFAITAYDPDAPTGSGWWHWVIFNIPATVNSIPMGAGTPDGAKLPAGAVQSVTDFGAVGYGGACPPPGAKAHRYVFTVYALNTEKLNLDAKAMPALVGFMISGTKLGEAKIVGKYAR
ncbi:MAG: YbhB/YbcL family Raf kinase inhibitor-like protein [Desulfovibrionaceae bacterium]